MSFVDPYAHPVTAALCEELAGMRETFIGLAKDMRFIDWPEPIYEGKWEVSSFKYRHQIIAGQFGEAAKAALEKLEVVHRPEIQTCGFSLLRPGADIKWHMGQAGDIWRLHFGLVCPEGDCALQVCDETKRWETGGFFMFNDQNLHRAWNRTESDRLILLVDIDKSKLAA
ncbi:MAG: hypothetical protein CMJ75_19195 [Planctomycetaceae bacterium]|nr:hypothetical protein [Planctomycetaceae bacterium]